MNLIINLIVWGILLLITIALWLYRRFLENREDHYIHLHGDEHDAKVLQSQAATGKRLDTITKTKNILVTIVIVYGLVIAALEIYRAWNNTGA
jgi:uncharacterized protein YxeA